MTKLEENRKVLFSLLDVRLAGWGLEVQGHLQPGSYMCEDPAADDNVALRAVRGGSAAHQSLFSSVGPVSLHTEHRMPGSR